MIWDYYDNRPFGHVRKAQFTPDELKKEVEKRLRIAPDYGFYSDAEYSEEAERQIRASLESVNYDMNEYMLTHSYNMIEDEDVREGFLIAHFLFKSPSDEILYFDELEISRIDILTEADDMNEIWKIYHERRRADEINKFDIYYRLYFCETEKDIWDIFADGVGSIDNMFDLYYYSQDDDDKAYEFLMYVYHCKHKFYHSVTCPQSVKNRIIDLLINVYFKGMHEEFFQDKNLEKVQQAWDTELLEVRTKFLKCESGIRMLKKIDFKLDIE